MPFFTEQNKPLLMRNIFIFGWRERKSFSVSVQTDLFSKLVFFK